MTPSEGTEKKKSARRLWVLPSIGIFLAVPILLGVRMAVPGVLVRVLHTEDYERQQWAIEKLIEIGRPSVPWLARALVDKDERIKELAAEALAAIGPDASAAVPALVEALLDEDIGGAWGHASTALASIGQAAVPNLIDSLSDSSEVTRDIAFQTLGQLKQEARGAVPYLIPFLRFEDVDDRSDQD